MSWVQSEMQRRAAERHRDRNAPDPQNESIHDCVRYCGRIMVMKVTFAPKLHVYMYADAKSMPCPQILAACGQTGNPSRLIPAIDEIAQ